MTRDEVRRLADKILKANGFRCIEGAGGRLSNRGIPYYLRETALPVSDDYNEDGLCRFTAKPIDGSHETHHETQWDAISARSRGTYEETCLLDVAASQARSAGVWTWEEQAALFALADGAPRDAVAEATGLSQRHVGELRRRAIRWAQEHGDVDEEE